MGNRPTRVSESRDAAFSQSARVGLRPLPGDPRARRFERFQCPRPVDVDDGVEVIGGPGMEVMALPFGIGSVDDADRPGQSDGAQRILRRATA